MPDNTSYILITCAKNEANFIGKTIESVIKQVIRPKKWIIINDGSSDNTEEIIMSYQKDYSFIQLISVPQGQKRDFASKVFGLRKGFESVKEDEYDFIGILDADVSFDENYYKNILLKFAQNPKLGIAGGMFYDVYNGAYHKVIPGQNSVRGAVQFFRRECFKQVGGYLPLENGGEDTVAEVSARMYGWETKTFTDITVLHHRRTGTASWNILQFRFKEGMQDHALGDDPIFELFKCIKNLFKKPYLIGGIVRISGYIWAKISNYKKVVSDRYIQYLKIEQRARLKFWSLKE